MPRRRPSRAGPRRARRAPDTAGMVSRLAELLGGDASYFALGARLGTHEENVRRYLNGSINPSVEFLATVAVEYGCSLDWLVLGKGKR